MFHDVNWDIGFLCSLVVNDLHMETIVSGSSVASSGVHRWAFCSNRNSCKSWMFVEENLDRKKKEKKEKFVENVRVA